MTIKLVFNDVDECLSKQIPSDGFSFNSRHSKDIDEFSYLVNKYLSVQFILCSGRSFSQLEGIIKKVKRLNWVISENGSIIHNLYSGKDIDLGESHPAKEYLNQLRDYAKKFTEEERIPPKKNMLTIDILQDTNPSYFQSFMKTLPAGLIKDSEQAGISFNWDPTAINISLPISKYDGIIRLLDLLAKQNKISLKSLQDTSLYIGDSTSDIEGMKACGFAATISNGDDKNRKVQEFVSKLDNGYVSPFSYGEGNRNCINHFLGEE